MIEHEVQGGIVQEKTRARKKQKKKSTSKKTRELFQPRANH
jgi:hypothetical protein